MENIVEGSEVPRVSKIFSVVESDNKTTWVLGESIPSTPADPNGPKIIAMFLIDGVVEIFAHAAKGHALHGHGLEFHFTIMPLHIKLVSSVVHTARWQEMLLDAQAYVDGLEEEEEEEEEPVAATPTAPAPAPSPVAPTQQVPTANGAT